MQYRFKMEYRLFTIVRYNYRDYNTPSKPNMHARCKGKGKDNAKGDKRQALAKRTSGRQQDSKKVFC